MKQKYSVLAASGGMDSSTLLLHLLTKGYKVLAINFDYGQKHDVEGHRAKSLVDFLNKKKLNVSFKQIKIGGFSDLINSHLIKGGEDIPTGYHYNDENIRQTVVENRNKIFGSFIQSAALALKNRSNVGDEVVISLANQAGDETHYPDCTQEFLNADLKAFHIGNWNAESIKYYTPFTKLKKEDVLKEGIKCCEELDLDYKDVYSRTFTSYDPIYLRNKQKKVYSNFKDSTSLARIEAFINVGLKDPIKYYDKENNRIVSWEEVKSYVNNILKK